MEEDRHTLGVAVKALILKDEKILVLTRCMESCHQPNCLDIPGGKVDPGEVPEEALAREIQEECGLNVEVLSPTRTWGFELNGVDVIGITYLCINPKGDVKLSEEHCKFEWMTLDDVEKLEHPEWLKKEVQALRKFRQKVC